MAVRKRKDGQWENRICVGYDSSGKEVRKSFYFDTKEQAKNMGKISSKIIIFFAENNIMKTDF